MATVGNAPKSNLLGKASNIVGTISTAGAIVGAVVGGITALTGPKPHDMAPEIPDSGPYYGVKNAFPGLSDDPSWPLNNRFVQAKELDGGKSWSADNKKSWLWLYTAPDGPFSIEDKSASNMQNFVDRLKALKAKGLIPANYNVSREYKTKVVDGRDLTFSFLARIESGQTPYVSDSPALAGFGGTSTIAIVGVGLLALMLLGKGK